MPSSFYINVRSHFSVGESLFQIPEIVEEVKRCGYAGAALVDTMTISSMVDFSNRMKKEGLKPIIGVRLRIVDDPTQKKLSKKDKEAGVKRRENRTWYPKLYALTEDGLKRIMRLLSRANADDRFYEVPRLGFDDLLSELDSDALAFSTGDFYSAFHLEEHIEILRAISDHLSASKTFVELVPVDTPLFDTLNSRAIRAGLELGLPFLVGRPALYKTVGDADTLEIMNAISRNVKIAEPWHNKQQVRDFTLKGHKELLDCAVAAAERAVKLRGIDRKQPWADGIRNIEKLAGMVSYEWQKMPVSLPAMAIDEYAELVAECRLGWSKRFTREVFGHRPSNEELGKVYVPRLKYELEILKKMGFENYFLLVQDLVRWSKDNGILVGPGRGSVGGSLVAYLLGITDVDPIRFGLLFERFINPERIDLPDADLDFMSTRRHEVVEYLVNKYGQEKVAGIANYMTLASGSALRDTARVSGIEMSQMTFTKLVPKEHGKPLSLEEAARQVPEIDRFKGEHPEIWRHATRLEGVMRGYGRHAAGIVVSGIPLIERAVVERRGGEATVNWDKRIVEDMGLVKMDILGLSTLDILKIATDHIFKRHGKKIDLCSVPLEDPEVMDAFGRGETVGVFQFESPGMRKLLRDLAQGGRLTFEDISAATALYRPGPMDSGLMDEFIAIKQGISSPSYDHPNMIPALESTYGVIVYQEQVMQVSRDLAGFTLAEADHLRKAMGKKDPEKMAEWRGRFVEGAVRVSGMEQKKAEALFDKIEKFAGYGFNKSHAVEYSLISYLSMWLKVKYPVEFYAAALTILDEDKLPGIVKDALERHIEVMPPDINISTGIFEILTDTQLCTPFNRLKGLSDNTTAAILAARKKAGGKFTSKDHFLSLVSKTKCNIRHQEVLDRVGAFARIEPSQPPANDPSRLKDQMELMPGLVVKAIKIERTIRNDAFSLAKLNQVVESYRACEKECPLRGGCHPIPTLGKSAKFMVVTDGPSFSEEKLEKIAAGQSFEYVSEALHLAGLGREHGYFTTLVKSPKEEGERFYSNEAINACTPYLRQEIEILKPPVIVALGSSAARFFIQDLKGAIVDHAGKAVYSSELDATILIGISPGMVAFDASKQRILNDVFKKVAELIS